MALIRGRLIWVQGRFSERGKTCIAFKGRTGDPQVKKRGREGSNYRKRNERGNAAEAKDICRGMGKDEAEKK